MDTAAGVKETPRKHHAYEGEACLECGSFTLIRNGTFLKCDTCGSESGRNVTQSKEQTLWPTIRISRRVYLEQVKRDWSDKAQVARYLADNLDTLSRECPMISRQALFGFLAAFGVKIASAETPEACIDAFIELMGYLACPEPGWEAATLIVED